MLCVYSVCIASTNKANEPVLSLYLCFICICYCLLWHTPTEILFGALGKIKKVKIYTTPLGQKKGDALVTFALPECAITAVFKVFVVALGVVYGYNTVGSSGLLL